MTSDSGIPFAPVGALVERRAPLDAEHAFSLGLDDVESWTGRLQESPGTGAPRVGRHFEPGDVLFGKLRPYLAKVWVSDRPGAYVGDFLCLVPRQETSSRFLSYVLLTRDFIQRATARSYGSKMPRIEWAHFKTLEVPLPPPSMQRAIADYLDHETAEIDAFIADLELASDLANLRFETKLASVFVEAPTWVPLRRVAALSTGSTPPSSLGEEVFDTEGVEWIAPGDIRDDRRITWGSRRLSPLGVSEVKVHDSAAVLVVGIGATVGRVGQAEGPFATNQQITAVTPNSVDTTYMYYALRSLSTYMRKTAHGNTLPIMNNAQLGNLEVPLVEASDQVNLAAGMDREMSQTNEIRSELAQTIELARERRAALISAAVTGQIDVTQRHRPVAEQVEDEVLERV